ncbi:hypothetical protein EDD11_010415 [Mortierella claussenii]|nr:hypothetical protein EDD11_010415 [Mortierella claussenii]
MVAGAKEEITEENEAKLMELFEKKRAQGRLTDVNMRPSTDEPPALSEVELTGDDDGYSHGSIKGEHWIYKPCGIPLGLMAGLACLFMFAYSSVLSAFVLQASRYPTDTNMPVFIFGLVFSFTSILSVFGFVITCLLARCMQISRTHTLVMRIRVLEIMFKIFHLLYFLTSLLTFGCMLGWLGLNKTQTGSWDRMYLSKTIASSDVLTFESLLQQDPVDPEVRIINPRIWIVSFLMIWVMQVYFWLCLVAYGRKTCLLKGQGRR